MKKQLTVTKVYDDVYNEYKSKKYRGVILEGGTGSSKSVSLAQLMVMIMIQERDILITVSRKTFPALRATAMKDVINALKELGIYREDCHNKSTQTFTYPATRSAIEFISIDDPMKVRSRRRNYLWMNETNEFALEDYRQMALRTDGQIFMDYNPSYQFHWIYDEIQTKKDVVVLRSSYLDNPFLSSQLVKEIESYKDKDKNYWRIYGLGLKGYTDIVVYSHWKFCNELPENYDVKIFGLDFGFNNQTALVELRIKDKDYSWRELLYQSSLTNIDLITELNKLVKEEVLKKTDYIYADSQEPARIEEIRRAGFNIFAADKESKSVGKGIDLVKSHGFAITKDSLNLLREVKAYSWKTKDGKPLDEPVKEKDHLMDAGRMAAYSYSKKKVLKITWN